MSIFPTAQEARNKVIYDSVVFYETVAIQTAVFTAIDNGELDATVTDTTMTTDDATGQLYFNVWNKTDVDRVVDEKMKNVISYFTNMGYSLTRVLNESTGNTFKWYIVF